MCVSLILCCMSHVEALTLIIYSGGQSVLWDQRAISYPLFLSPKIAVMHWSDTKSLQQAMCVYHIPWILVLGANYLVIGTPFNKEGCLQ